MVGYHGRMLLDVSEIALGVEHESCGKEDGRHDLETVAEGQALASGATAHARAFVVDCGSDVKAAFFDELLVLESGAVWAWSSKPKADLLERHLAFFKEDSSKVARYE